MSRLDKILETGAEPAPRRVQRRVGTVVVILFAALTGWAVFKHAATGDLAGSEIDAGIDDLAAGIRGGERASFEAAEDHFVDAASVSVFDRYPAFLISSTRKISGEERSATAHDEISGLVKARDFDAARQRVDELRGESPDAAKYWLRLLDELESRLDE